MLAKVASRAYLKRESESESESESERIGNNKNKNKSKSKKTGSRRSSAARFYNTLLFCELATHLSEANRRTIECQLESERPTGASKTDANKKQRASFN